MIPDKKTKPVFEMEKFKWLVYGQPKVGKTTFASQFKDAIFFATEDGHSSIEVYKVDIKTWEDFLEYARELYAQIEEGKCKFKTIIIDTADNLYDMCMDHVCIKHKMEHPSDEGYGKGWKLVQTEWTRKINAITRMGLGVVFISHSKEIPFKFRNMEVTKTTYTISGQAGTFIAGLCDIVAYVGFNTKNAEERLCYVQGNESLTAGDRTGKLGSVIPFDYKEIQKQMEGK